MKKTFFEFRKKQKSIQKHTQTVNNLKTYLSAYGNEIIFHKQKREHENQNDYSEKTENSKQQSATTFYMVQAIVPFGNLHLQ